jgi:hypothetical protein
MDDEIPYYQDVKSENGRRAKKYKICRGKTE